MKKIKLNNRAKNQGDDQAGAASGKLPRSHKAFIFGAKATGRVGARTKKPRKDGPKGDGTTRGKALPADSGNVPVAAVPLEGAELTEAIKGLLELARDQHYLPTTISMTFCQREFHRMTWRRFTPASSTSELRL